MADDILKIISSSLSPDDPVPYSAPSCENWYIPTRVSLNPQTQAVPCSLKLSPTDSTCSSHASEVLEELIASTPLTKHEPSSILDSLLPLDEKFANQTAHKALLEELSNGSSAKVPNKIPGEFVSTFAPNGKEQLYSNLWTAQEFDPLTGMPYDLKTEFLQGNDERLEVIEEQAQSSNNSTNTRPISMFMTKKVNKKRTVAPTPNLKTDPDQFLSSPSEGIALSSRIEAFLAKGSEATIESLLEDVERPRASVTVTFTEIQKPEKNLVSAITERMKPATLAEEAKASPKEAKKVEAEEEAEPKTELDALISTKKGVEIPEYKGIRVIKPQSHKVILSQVKKEQDVWIVVDDKSVENFNAQLPNPALTYPFELDPFQKRAILRLEEGQCVFVAAHTSAGKTVVAEYAIALARKNLKKAIYTSPIKALSNQKYREFKTKFGAENVGILTGDVCLNPQANCLIVTTEVLQHMLYKSADITRDIDWVIFDEVHYVNDEERGFVWEEIIIMLPDHINIVMLSATVPNYQEFANWVGTTKRKVVYIQATFKRPVPLEHYLYFQEKLLLIKGQDDKINETNYAKATKQIQAKRDVKFKKSHHRKELGRSEIISKQMKRKEETLEKLIKSESKLVAEDSKNINIENTKQSKNLQQFVNFLYEKDYTPAIVFCFSRVQCETYASSIATSVNLITKAERSAILSFYRTTLQRLKDADRNLPQIKRLSVFLQAGIGVHHAGMLPILKETVEILFSQGLIKVLFATTTFAMGVNMPARTVAFLKMKKRDNKGDLKMLDSSEYLQMAGRAGRRGKDSKGIVIIYTDSTTTDLPDMTELKGVLEGKGIPLESKFKITYKMMLHLLQSESVDITEVMHFSFIHYYLMLDIMKKQKQRKIIMERLTKGKSTDCSCEDISGEVEIIEGIYKLNQVIAFMHKPELTPGRLITVMTGDYFNAKAVIISTETTKDSLLLINAVVLSSTEPVKKDKPLPLFAKFKGTLDSGEYFEYAKLKLENIISVINYSFKQDLQVNTHTQVENIAERLSEHISRSKLTETKPNKQTLKEREKRAELWKTLEKSGIMNCPYWGAHLEEAQERKQDKATLGKLDMELSSGDLKYSQDYQNKLAVLKKLGYVDLNNCLLIKGKVAREISGGEIILLTEMLFNKHLRDISAEDLVALVSVLAIEEKKDHDIDVNLSDKYNEMQDKMLKMSKELYELEKACGVYITDSYLDKLHFGLAPVIYYWAQGKDFNAVTDMTTIHEGSIVRGIMRVEYILRELKNAAGIMGDSKLKELCTEAQNKIKRDIIFTPSLYIQ